MSGSSISSMRTPQTVPLIAAACGGSCAAAKKSANVVPASRWDCSAASSKPVSHEMT